MAAVHGAGPGGFLAAGDPLARHVPTAHLPRVGRVRQVQDHADVAHVAFRDRREVGVAAVEGEAVNALGRGLVERHLPRPGGIGDVEDLEASLGVVVVLVALVVDDHHAVSHRRLVRVNSRGHADLGRQLGILGVAHVDDRSAVGRVHVADVGETVVHLDLAAAGEVHARDLLDLAGRAETVAFCHLVSPSPAAPRTKGCACRAGAVRLYVRLKNDVKVGARAVGPGEGSEAGGCNPQPRGFGRAPDLAPDPS